MITLQPELTYPAAATACALLGSVFDVKSRRIPNFITFPAFLFGLVLHFALGGWRQFLTALAAGVICGVVFLIFYLAGGMGAGDVKLFAAIGAVTGAHLVLPTFMIVVLTGGLLALVSIIRAGVLMSTMHRVLQILVGMLPGWEMPRFAVPADRTHTIPYGVAITIGSIISTAVFRA